MGEFFRRIYYLLNRRRLERELANDLDVHREMLGRDYQRGFGNTLRVREQAREAWGWTWLDHFAMDMRYGLRMLRKSPGFTVVALITLTLGIGGNTTIFTLTNAMLLRSLPVQRPNELVRIRFAKPDQDFGLSGPMFDEIRKRQQVYNSVLAWSDTNAELSDSGEVRKVSVGLASGGALDVLGVRPVLGRGLTPDDDKPGGGPDGWTAMLSYGYWTSRYNRDLHVLGRSLTIHDIPVTIVGVLPQGFESVNVGSHLAAVLPLEFETRLHDKGSMRHMEGALWLTVIGRRKKGVTLAQAREEIERIGPGILHDVDRKGILSRGFFAGSKWGAESGRTGRLFLRSTYSGPLLFLQLLVGLILLVCCANVAGLMLARSSARRQEFAVRAALGASRMRLLRQLFIEGALLAFAGAIVGLTIAKLASEKLVATLMGQNQVTFDLSPNDGVLVFTTIVAVVTTVISALPSTVRATRLDPVEDLKSSRTILTTGTRTESLLVLMQVGLSAVLLVAAGLLAGTLHRLLTVDPGFSTSGMVIIPTDFSKQGKSGEERMLLYEQLLRRVSGLPSVQTVSAEELPLLAGWRSMTEIQSVLPDGSIRKDQDLSYNRVGPNYFATAGTRVVAGRDVQFTDRLKAPLVCWLNQSAAAFFFPGVDPVGQTLTSGEKDPDHYQVAGVVQNAKYGSLRESTLRLIYWAALQEPMENSLRLVVRTDNVEAATTAVRRVLHEMAPTAPVLDAITVREQLHESIGREQVTAILALFFGGLALLLAAVGIYGLLSYQALQRTREIGIRIALGATRGNVLGLVVRRVLLLTVIGLGAGLAAASVVARLFTGLLFEVKPKDPMTYTLAALVLLGAALVASYLPARRASRIDPMMALRSE